MLFPIFTFLALWGLTVLGAPIAIANATGSADSDTPAHLIPSPTFTDRIPSLMARAPLQEVTQNLDVNDPGPGGRQEQGGPKEESWIDRLAQGTAPLPKKGCVVM